jgi:hypothetical protein
MKFDDLNPLDKVLLINGTVSAKALDLLSKATGLSMEFWLDEVSTYAEIRLRSMSEEKLDELLKRAKREIDESLIREHN